MLRIPKTIIDRRSSPTRRWLSAALLWCITLYGIAPMIIQAQIAVNGNISPNKIEIDQFANVTQGGPGTVLNALDPGNAVDWQRDALSNTDAPSLNGGVAIGIIPNLTGAPGGMGHWYGARIVDGVGGGEQDQFLQGGKVNDPSTWTIGPGSIGSAKYDAS